MYNLSPISPGPSYYESTRSEQYAAPELLRMKSLILINFKAPAFHPPSAFTYLLRPPQFIPCQLPRNSPARVLRWYLL